MRSPIRIPALRRRAPRPRPRPQVAYRREPVPRIRWYS